MREDCNGTTSCVGAAKILKKTVSQREEKDEGDSRIPILLGQLRQHALQGFQLPPDNPESLADLQYRRIVHDVLRRGTPVDVLCMLIGCLLDELSDQR